MSKGIYVPFFSFLFKKLPSNPLSKSSALLSRPLWPLLVAYIWLCYRIRRWDIELNPKLISMLESGQPFIACFPHGRLLMMPPLFAFHPKIKSYRFRLAVLISLSRDGGIIARIARAFNAIPVRGSSFKSGVSSTKKLVACLNDGTSVALTPDGPIGPRLHFTEGAKRLSLISGCPLVFCSYSTKACIEFKKSWDHFMLPLPLPFAKASFVAKEPFWPKEDEKLEFYSQIMYDTVSHADALLGRKPPNLPTTEEITARKTKQAKTKARNQARKKAQGYEK